MNRNSKLIKRGLTTSLAVGMSVMVGAMPVYAASSDKKITMTNYIKKKLCM